MTSVVRGTIQALGNRYADGTERMEIWVPSDRANGLPYVNGNRVPIDLQINGDHYHAGLRATANNDYVWISPDVKTKDGVSKKLAHVLTNAGFKKNDKVFLLSDGESIVLQAASSTAGAPRPSETFRSGGTPHRKAGSAPLNSNDDTAFRMDSNVPVDFSQLWASIIEELNAWDSTWPAKIEALDQIGRVRDRRRGRTFTDEEIFEGIVKAVLSNATDWSRIQKLLPELSQRFGGFDVGWYSCLTETNIANDLLPWFRSHGAGGQYLERNLRFLVPTAAKLVERKAQCGNLENYLSGLLKYLNGDVIHLAKELGATSSNKLDGFGIPIAAEALKNIGYDVGKPDRHINRAFGSFNLQVFHKWPDRSGTKPPEETTRTENLAVMRILRQFADHLKVEATLVDNAIWLLCARSGAYLSNERLSKIRTRHANP